MRFSKFPAMMNVPDQATQMLRTLLPGIQQALGDGLVGVYLRGSLALGDFAPDTSDLDFLAVTELPVSGEKFAVLKLFHTRLAQIPNKYAGHLEGAYMDRAALKRFRAGERHPTLERGEVLRLSEHRSNWVLERWIVREHGIPLFGPDPKTLIEPVSADELRAAVSVRLRDWADWANEPDDPAWRLPLSHKAYVVETMCRAVRTLACGDICSKPRAVRWALETFPEPWRSLVELSRAWRTDTSLPDPAVIGKVRRFVHWAASQAEGTGPIIH